jgi:hypothetical protein
MTKTNQKILDALLTNAELAEHKDFITEVLERSTKSGPKAPEHPDYTDEATGIEMKWCIRHEQYEPKSEWTVGKNGRMDQSCDVAVKHWRKLTKELKALTDELLETGDEETRIAAKAKAEERSGKFTPEYTTEELLEQAAPITPSRK